MFITVPFLTLAGVGAGPSNRLRLRLRNSAHCHIPLPYLNFMRGVNKTHIDETPPPQTRKSRHFFYHIIELVTD